jgi:hypothetical protein
MQLVPRHRPFCEQAMNKTLQRISIVPKRRPKEIFVGANRTGCYRLPSRLNAADHAESLTTCVATTVSGVGDRIASR